jgi:HSP20 family protein
MSSIMRRDPFEATGLNRIFSTFFDDPFFMDVPRVAIRVPGAIEEGTLPLDISEDEKNVIVRASLPGFRKDDIEVEVHDGVLSIKAQAAEEKEEKGETYYRRERRMGSVSRRVALPATVIEGEAQAELKDGVLTLRIPKVAKLAPRKIKIA